MIKCSLIISTYNWPKALDFCLQSVLQQAHLPDEVLIADDGSGAETILLIKKYQKTFPVPLIHVWHEDRGFRLSTIRNKAVASAKNNYIIQIDGDIILESNFIFDHLRIAKKNYIVRGTRAMLNEETTNAILSRERLPAFSFLQKKCGFKLNTIRNHFISSILRDNYKTRGNYRHHVKGCNMAFWRDSFIKINGYNEAITGWGCEDIELTVRLLKTGIKKQSLNLSGIAFHLHHPVFSRNKHQTNMGILDQSTRSERFCCEKGVKQYL